MPSSVAKRFGYALKRAQHALRVCMDDSLRPLDLTTPQYAVLCAIEAETGMSNARLARAAFVTPQTMHGLLTNLERSGLLARDAAPVRGRVLRTRLTNRGQEVLRKAHGHVALIEDRMIASLGATNSTRIAAALAKCADDLTGRGRPAHSTDEIDGGAGTTARPQTGPDDTATPEQRTSEDAGPFAAGRRRARPRPAPREGGRRRD